MTSKLPLRRLSAKLLAMLLLAAGLGTLVGIGVNLAGRLLISRVYCGEPLRSRRELSAITQLRDYVRANRIASTDAQRIGQWNEGFPYVQLSISANGTMVNSDRWGADLLLAQNGLVMNITSPDWEGGTYVVNFADGPYQVQLREFSQDRLYPIAQGVSILVGAFCFLLLMLLYNRAVTSAVTRLAGQVRQVSTGDLALEILPTSTDEIGGLARDVDAMRLSILDKLHREEAAWAANTELLTAISHDVRTPLTSLMGYLELMKNPDLTPEQREEYLRLCTARAGKLKELTDELFGYFLVFGKPQPDLTLEDFPAPTLSEQLLGEAAAELEAAGFQVWFPELPESGTVRVDLSALRRVLDNLFSNIRKYADPEFPVEISARASEGKLCITLRNAIRKDTDRPESTRIGLQTCEKLLTSMNGTFSRTQEADSFTAAITLPLWDPSAAPEAEDSGN